jgi:hypothetical protein
MAMLGVIHRCVLGKGPGQIREYFNFEASNHTVGRSALRRHNRQLTTYRTGKFLETTAKSIFGLIDIYNLLPQAIVDANDVHLFQAKLQGMLKGEVRKGRSDWETLFSPRHPLHLHPLARLLNGRTTITTKDGSSTCDDSGIGDAGSIAPNAMEDKPPSWW